MYIDTYTCTHICTGKNQLSSWTLKPRLEQIHIINRVKSLCSRWNPRRLARHFVRDYAIPSRQNWQSLAVRPLHQIVAPMSNHIILWRQDWPKWKLATCSEGRICVRIFKSLDPKIELQKLPFTSFCQMGDLWWASTSLCYIYLFSGCWNIA